MGLVCQPLLDQPALQATAVCFSSPSQMVSLLLSKGANNNAFDKKDGRALHWAAFMGESSSTVELTSSSHQISLLIGRAIDGEKPSDPPAGHLEVLCLLVAHGGEISCKDKRGYTPLHAAASSGQITVVKHLLSLAVEVGTPASKSRRTGEQSNAGATHHQSLLPCNRQTTPTPLETQRFTWPVSTARTPLLAS